MSTKVSEQENQGVSTCSCGHSHEEENELTGHIHCTCGCEDGHHHHHEHKHEHGESCSCGHDHSHEDEDDSLTGHIHCTCGCEDGHHHHHEHKHGESCSCGHDHSHEDEDDSLTGHIHCTCGCEDGHDHHHPHEDDDSITGHVKCSCGCEDGHDHHHHHHSHDDSITGHVKCSCGCEDGHEHTHEHSHSAVATAEKPALTTKKEFHYMDLYYDYPERMVAAAAVIYLAVTFLPLPQVAKLPLMVLATLTAALPLLWGGVKKICRLKFDETSLLTIAVIAAFLIGEYSEAVMVTILFRVGNLIEDSAIARSKRDIEALTKIRPNTANLVRPDGSVVAVAAKSVKIGSTIVVKPGEKVPVDCVILEGGSAMDTSALTGESLTRNVEKGDTLLSGMVNVDGMLTCKTTASFHDSAASRIIQMVKDSTAKKGKTENFISRFAKVYTPFIIFAAAALAFLPPLLGMGELSMWVGRSLVFLVASCPCALVISIPLSFFAGIGANSKIGVLVKGSKYIETLSKANCVVFDKTGTLTSGKLSVTSVVSCSDLSEEEVAELAAIAESYSNHPMAQAVVANHPNVDLSGVSDYSEITGKGVSLKRNGQDVLCGSHRLMEDNGVDISGQPEANIYLAVSGKLVGYITLFDNPREDAKETIQNLKKLGVSNTVMLTGDSAYAAGKVQEMVGIDKVYAELLPEDKVSHLEKIKNENGVTLFVGDGINDAPVLAMADVGVAMGFGTDAAIEAADVVLLSDKPSSLPRCMEICRRNMSIAKFNIVFALSVKAVVLALGALGMAQMWMAVVADVGVSVCAVLNATRIMRVKQ